MWHVWEREVDTGFWCKDLRERDHLEDLGEAGRIIIKWIFRKYNRWCVVDCAGSGKGQAECCCESGNEPSVPIN